MHKKINLGGSSSVPTSETGSFSVCESFTDNT